MFLGEHAEPNLLDTEKPERPTDPLGADVTSVGRNGFGVEMPMGNNPNHLALQTGMRPLNQTAAKASRNPRSGRSDRNWRPGSRLEKWLDSAGGGGTSQTANATAARTLPPGSRRMWHNRIVEKDKDGKWHVVGHSDGQGSVEKLNPAHAKPHELYDIARKILQHMYASGDHRKPSVSVARPYNKREPADPGAQFARKSERLKGGRGDNQPDSRFDPKELALGIEDEMEHTSDRAVAKEIAKDHLMDDPHYYSKMAKGETAEARRKRNAKPHNRAARRAYNSSAAGKAAHRKAQDAYESKHPDRVKAQQAARHTHGTGSHKCKCGSTATHKHHTSYGDNPKVQWLCHACHVKAHHPKSNLTSKSLSAVRSQMPTNLVRTKADEKRWERAKEAARKQNPDNLYALTNHIFQQMKKNLDMDLDAVGLNAYAPKSMNDMKDLEKAMADILSRSMKNAMELACKAMSDDDEMKEHLEDEKAEKSATSQPISAAPAADLAKGSPGPMSHVSVMPVNQYHIPNSGMLRISPEPFGGMPDPRNVFLDFKNGEVGAVAGHVQMAPQWNAQALGNPAEQDMWMSLDGSLPIFS